MTVTIEILRSLATTTNRYGDTVPDWTQTQVRHVHRCKLAPTSETEPRGDHRDGIVSGFTLYAPTTALEATERVRVGADTYEIDGEPNVWPAGVEAKLRKVDG